MPLRYVGVVGPGEEAPAPLLTAARAIGRGLAERGLVLLNGGLGGVMLAASEGAREAGGMVLGLLPGLDREAGNAALSLSLPTGLGELRNGLLVRSSELLVSVGGSWGTLSEVALACRAGVPVISFQGWGIVGPGHGGVVGGPIDTPSVSGALAAVDEHIARWAAAERIR